MKYFTPRICRSWDLEPLKEAYREYALHLEGLRGLVPERVLQLAELPGMDDGLVVHVDQDRDRRVLRLVLRCGDSQMGYYNLVLTYMDAEVRPKHDDALARIARSTKSQSVHGCDLAYHEIDVATEGRIEHRFNFNALDWFHPTAKGHILFTVRCRALRWRREPKRSRRLQPSLDRYPSGPKD